MLEAVIITKFDSSKYSEIGCIIHIISGLYLIEFEDDTYEYFVDGDFVYVDEQP